MAQDQYVLNGSFKFVPERGEYIGVISQIGKDGVLTVVSIGAEATETGILEWIRESIKVMRETGVTNVQASDMYDRAAATKLN